MTNSFYDGQRVVVLGGAGFVGHHLVAALREAGAEVVVVDDLSRGRNRTSHDVIGDAANTNTLRYAYLGNRMRGDTPVFAVFNLAAKVAGVAYNQMHHLEMFGDNISLLTRPVAVAEQVGVPHFLQVSSACVYAPGYTAPCIEENGHLGEPVGANAGYSWAKRMGERVIWMSKLSHAVIVRPTNIYGPGDYFDEKGHVIPNLIKKALNDSEITIFGSGEQTRSFVYVQDAATGMMAALAGGRHKEAYNLGSITATTGRISVKALAYLVGLSVDPEYGRPLKHSESTLDPGDRDRYSDCTKIYRETGWQPKIDLEDGLHSTVSWYRSTIK